MVSHAAVGTLHARAHAAARLLEARELATALHRDAELGQAIDQELLVLVLWEHEGEGKRTQAGAEIAEYRARAPLAGDPEAHRRHAVPAVDDRAGQMDLAVELERARLNGERPRSRAGLCRTVDEADRDFQVRQPQGEHQAGGSGADDEHGSIGHEMPFW